jgi:hypothetical protein
MDDGANFLFFLYVEKVMKLPTSGISMLMHFNTA